jgi:predicted nucleotidyltransferase
VHLDLPPTLSDHRRSLLTSAATRLDTEHGSGLLGLVLSGSAARGLETDLSDLDLLVILEPEIVHGPRAPQLRSAELELLPMTLDDLETPAAVFRTEAWAYRWSYAWAPVLADRTGGRISRAIERQTHLTPAETMSIMIDHDQLGSLINLSYRALKSARDDRTLEARLDASEAIPMFLEAVFALNGLVRPYNKFLPWALRHHPLPDWPADDLLAVIGQWSQGDATMIKYGLARVHEAAVRFDEAQQQTVLRDVFDHWSPKAYNAVLGLPI